MNKYYKIEEKKRKFSKKLKRDGTYHRVFAIFTLFYMIFKPLYYRRLAVCGSVRNIVPLC